MQVFRASQWVSAQVGFEPTATVNKMARRAGHDPAVRFPSRVMEMPSGFEPESSNVWSLHFRLCYDITARCLTNSAHLRTNQTRLVVAIQFSVVNLQATYSSIEFVNLALQLRVFQMVAQSGVEHTVYQVMGLGRNRFSTAQSRSSVIPNENFTSLESSPICHPHHKWEAIKLHGPVLVELKEENSFKQVSSHYHHLVIICSLSLSHHTLTKHQAKLLRLSSLRSASGLSAI